MVGIGEMEATIYKADENTGRWVVNPEFPDSGLTLGGAGSEAA
jgi:hypothetical protein